VTWALPNTFDWEGISLTGRLVYSKQNAPSAGFYVDYQYARAEQFLSWLTNLIHTTYAFRNVGMIGIVNEPIQNADTVVTMRSSYYPGAYNVDFSTPITLTS